MGKPWTIITCTITRWQEDMNVMFEWQEQLQYLTSYPTRAHGIIVICSFYYINKLMAAFLMIFQKLPTTFRRFRRFSKIVPKARRTLANIFREFPEIPKMSEDFRRLSKIADYRGRPEDVSMIHQLF